MITRFAPTPSGYLHAGNAANALLVSWLAAQEDGEILLRVDDVDAPRTRAEYVADIFDLLHWLGISWQHGPRDPDDLRTRYSMTTRADHYWQALMQARDRGLEVFACTCSRSMLDASAGGGCVGGCRTAGRPLETGTSSMRAHLPRATSASDVVLWRRDGIPAYHLVSVVEDRDWSITHVVRGIDLADSTSVQVALAPYLDAQSFVDATVLHHALVVDEAGGKLSKSQTISGRPLDRTPEMRAYVHDLALRLGEPLGITP